MESNITEVTELTKVTKVWYSFIRVVSAVGTLHVYIIVASMTFLKVHLCRFENLPISLSSYVEDFTLEHFLFFEICAREICEKIVYKYSGKMKHVKN